MEGDSKVPDSSVVIAFNYKTTTFKIKNHVLVTLRQEKHFDKANSYILVKCIREKLLTVRKYSAKRFS